MYAWMWGEREGEIVRDKSAGGWEKIVGGRDIDLRCAGISGVCVCMCVVMCVVNGIKERAF